MLTELSLSEALSQGELAAGVDASTLVEAVGAAERASDEMAQKTLESGELEVLILRAYSRALPIQRWIEGRGERPW